MHKHLPAKTWGDGWVQAHGSQHLVPVDGEVGVIERSALVVDKDMGLILPTKVLCEQLVSFREVHPHKLCQVMGEIEADGCSAPWTLILVMRQMHVKRCIAIAPKLVAMTRGAIDAIRLVTGAIISQKHERPDARQPDGW